MPFATFELTNVNIGVPDRDTSSDPTLVARPADPLAVAANVRSYTLLSPVRPVTVSPNGRIVALLSVVDGRV